MIWLVVGQALNYLGIINNKLFIYGGWKGDSTLASNREHIRNADMNKLYDKIKQWY